ncbi:hypothetical protein EGR_07960 [Echinococcus granulosus]|uniref:Uncharacterized protein n=1 Tax=Echinococcus granulosus TaxID=6210 RepID=W6U9L6_ECHGR|nr:hypothetical protein EGR_07960 [Echinococcus granulosus]EUB57211.1 hypothetical protein EGR_07960 [Echinococcus granulosus]
MNFTLISKHNTIASLEASNDKLEALEGHEEDLTACQEQAATIVVINGPNTL